MFISNLVPSSTVLQPIDSNIHDPLIKIIATVLPIPNGRDSNGNIICLGPQTTKIPRYLLVISMARSSEVFRAGAVTNSIIPVLDVEP
jgi:hypothetical protein